MFKLGFLALLYAAAGVSGSAQQPTFCLMQPNRVSIRLPEEGLIWLEDEILKGACEAVPPDAWRRASSKTAHAFVHADGPAGSGRFWTITVGLSEKLEPRPTRGACFMASTVGWRTLLRFKDAPLPWMDDLDNDSAPELIVWNSFPLRQEATEAEFGLNAWVYQIGARGDLAIDWKLSRRLAGELATAYRAPLNDQLLRPMRNNGARALEAFATGSCAIRNERPR